MVNIGNLLNVDIVVITQWPDVKNAEYELIEKIRRVSCSITVVDYLGFNVDNGQLINDSEMHLKYDFAIALHYDTPKLLNLPTYLWLSNPLQYMHTLEGYRDRVSPNIRSFDNFLFNGSSVLKKHISYVVSNEHSLLSHIDFYPSSAISELDQYKCKSSINTPRLFYCGINWEATIDAIGRSESLLKLLDNLGTCDFFGPKIFKGHQTWAGFKSYKGEIPFDGISLINEMSKYQAVLAISSPAHLKSKTSSSRVFEGAAAGVPVISDKNEHVYNLFGDSIYYFDGKTDQEKVESIINILNIINNNPKNVLEHVTQARQLMCDKYCFENSFVKALEVKKIFELSYKEKFSIHGKHKIEIDIFSFFHFHGRLIGKEFDNLEHILSSINYVCKVLPVVINLYIVNHSAFSGDVHNSNLNVKHIDIESTPSGYWLQMILGGKIEYLSKYSTGDYSCYFTQYDYPQYDYFVKALNWFQSDPDSNTSSIYLSGVYENNLENPIIENDAEVNIYSLPLSKYRWGNGSLLEHHLGSMLFSRKSLIVFDHGLTNLFDAALPIFIILVAKNKSIQIYRSPYLLLRVSISNYNDHYNEYLKLSVDGAWSPRYNALTNYKQELNALYDVCGDSKSSVGLVDKIRIQAASVKAVKKNFLDLIVDINSADMKHIVVYGAGNIGFQFFSMSKTLAPKVNISFVDARASKKQFFNASIDVYSTEWLGQNIKNIDGIVIASDAFYDEIYANIETMGLSKLVLN